MSQIKSILSIKNLFIIILILILTTIAYGKDFKFYWNIPTFMCRKYQTPIPNVTYYYGIIQNKNDDFRGDQITILYDPGNFPAILQNSSSKQYFHRNGGVPQLGDIYNHLQMLENHINELIPDPNFDGLAIIDFESWRPIYRQNFGTLQPYKDLSERIVKYEHPFWNKNSIEREAGRQFEYYAKKFINETIVIAQKLREHATWGYYGLPLCFNGRGNNPESCPGYVQKENNNLQWLFDTTDAIYPSVYLSEEIPLNNRISMVRGRVHEAKRLAKRLPKNIRPEVYVYHRYMYTDTLKYLTETDTFSMFNAIKQAGADGVILWGSSNDLNTREKCTNFYNYLVNSLGPVIYSFQPHYTVQSYRTDSN